MVFEHPTQLDTRWQPPPGGLYADAPKVRCVVTAVRQGRVYWRLEDSVEKKAAYYMTSERFDAVKVLRQPERCLTCGSTQGVWSADSVDPQWTCQRCGDEWSKATFLADGEE